jgi:hypothetical protein
MNWSIYDWLNLRNMDNKIIFIRAIRLSWNIKKGLGLLIILDDKVIKITGLIIFNDRRISIYLRFSLKI